MIEPAIREARIADVESVLPLVEEFVTSFAVDRDAFRTSFQKLIVDDSALVLVVETGGSLVGYCLGFVHGTFYANGPVAWLEEIMVQAEHRRSGLGGRLMEAFETWSKQKGAILSALSTRRAARFYEAIGYEESATYYRRLL
jgi:GNAT superfamily N-acetyltransferase